MSKHILVTGGSGFIGCNFIRHVLNSTTDKVTNVDALTYAGNRANNSDLENNRNYDFIRADLSNYKDVQKVFEREYDVIVHFAAESHVDRSIDSAAPFISTNIVGTYHLLEQVLKGKTKRYIQISTDEVYGSLEKEEESFIETTPISPNNPYSASKASADLLVKSFWKTYQIPVLITRCSNNYGPFQHPEKLIPKTIFHALNNKEIPLYGDGLQIRDWLYVEDHCEAIYTVLEAGRIGEVYNIGGYNELTNLELVELILSYLGKDSSLIKFVKDRKGHDRRYSINWEKINNELGWKPKMGIRQGLKKTIDWYRENDSWKQRIDGGHE
jgi:dTDP-glucose 4,6-dehydratase